MRTEKFQGQPTKYWDFDADAKLEDGTVVKGDWNRQATEVSVTGPDNIQEMLEVAGGNEARLLEIVWRGLQAEAEDRAGVIPEGAFSKAMVAAIDVGYRAMPQFAGIKSSADRRPLIMRFVGANEALKAGLAVGFAHLRNVTTKGDDSE